MPASQRALRLAVFTNRFPGKVCTFFARDMRALVEAGVEIDIFPIYPLEPDLWRYVPEILAERHLPRERVHHGSTKLLLRSLGPARTNGLRTFLRDATAITVAAARAGLGPLAKSVYVLPLGWAWARLLETRYDHVLAYWGNYAGTCAYIYHRLAAPHVPFSLYLHAGNDLFINQVFLREKLLYADSIVTECEFNRQYMRERFPDIFPAIAHKIHVNLMGLDFGEFPYQPDNRNPRRVIGVGRLHRAKGYDFLLRAVAELSRRGLDVECELVGDGDEAAALRALADELGIRDRVIFRGWVVFREVRSAMLQAAVLVHPSSDVGDAKPNVIQEAIALGTPVVASDVAGIPELLDGGRCGILVPPRDVRRLADAIQTLLQNADLRHGYAERARRHAEATLDLWRNGVRLADHLRAATRQAP